MGMYSIPYLPQFIAFPTPIIFIKGISDIAVHLVFSILAFAAIILAINHYLLPKVPH